MNDPDQYLDYMLRAQNGEVSRSRITKTETATLCIDKTIVSPKFEMKTRVLFGLELLNESQGAGRSPEARQRRARGRQRPGANHCPFSQISHLMLERAFLTKQTTHDPHMQKRGWASTQLNLVDRNS